MSEFDKDREVIEAAIDGPWEAAGFIAERTARMLVDASGQLVDNPVDINNRIFISRARTRWPVALEEIERLRRDNELLLAVVEAGDCTCPRAAMKIQRCDRCVALDAWDNRNRDKG